MQKRNLVALLSVIILCVSCGSGGSLPASLSPNSANEQAFGFSSVLRIPAIVPTNTPSVYELDVLNVTDKILNFNHVDLQFIHAGQLIPNINESSYLDVNDCMVLNPHSRCTLHYAPQTVMHNDVIAFKLKFNDAQQKMHSFSQMVETISIPAMNGFYVNSSQKLNIVSNKNYTVTIPFVVAEDLQNLKLTTLSQNLVNQQLSCSTEFIAKNSNCTATLEFLPGNDNTEITISGLAQDQIIKQFTIKLISQIGNPNTIAVSNKSIIIDNTESSTHQASLFVLNNSSNDIHNVVSSISNTSNAITDITYQCNGQNYKQIPSSFLPGDICLVTFYVAPHSNGILENFRVAFDQASGVDLPSTVSSVLYFINNLE